MMLPLRSQLFEVVLITRASVDLLRVDVTLQRSGFQELATRLQTRPACDLVEVRPRDIRRARRYARRIATAARVSLPRARCLHRSLVLHGWLRRDGLPSELRIGVLKDGDKLKAHAWVELAGQVVNDPPHAIAVFTPLTRHPSLDDASPSWNDQGNLQWQ